MLETGASTISLYWQSAFKPFRVLNIPGKLKTKRQEDPEQHQFCWEPIDVTDTSSLKTFLLKVYKKYGSINGLINNAGINLDRLLPLTTEPEITTILKVNLESVIFLSHQVSRIMLAQSFW